MIQLFLNSVAEIIELQILSRFYVNVALFLNVEFVEVYSS